MVIGGSATLRAMPKSVSLIWPSSPISTLPGLTSRCVIPARCAAASAAAAAATRRPRPARSASAPCSRDQLREAARRHQLHDDERLAVRRRRRRRPSHVGVGEHRDARGPRAASARAASCRLALGHPGGSRTSLTATGRRSTSSKPDHTVPIAPPPSCSAAGSARRSGAAGRPPDARRHCHQPCPTVGRPRRGARSRTKPPIMVTPTVGRTAPGGMRSDGPGVAPTGISGVRLLRSAAAAAG